MGIYESPIHINGYQTLPLLMLCFPWVVGWVQSQGWQPDNSSKAAAMWAKSAMEKQGRMKGYGMDYSMKIVKEIYKSQVYCVKNKTFINFALENRR